MNKNHWKKLLITGIALLPLAVFCYIVFFVGEISLAGKSLQSNSLQTTSLKGDIVIGAFYASIFLPIVALPFLFLSFLDYLKKRKTS